MQDLVRDFCKKKTISTSQVIGVKDINALIASHESGGQIDIEIDSAFNFADLVSRSLLVSYAADNRRKFVVICSKSDEIELVVRLQLTDLVTNISPQGEVWLYGANDLSGVPTVIIRQCERGEEELLAGFCFKHARMFIDADHISAKGFLVAVASMSEPDNSITALYRKFRAIPFEIK